MKTAVCTICYNEDWIIRAVIENWKGKVAKHLILHTDKPWHGQELPHDTTQDICAEYPHVEFVRLPWSSEHEQRNWGLARLYDYDYVLIVDADELYTEGDQLTILSSLGKKNQFEDNQNCYRAERIATYFKSTDYTLSPPDTHKPLIAVDPKKILFREVRIPSQDYQIPLPVVLHHLSYVRDDIRLFHKLQQFEHCGDVKNNWYQEKWKNWTPDTEDVRAYGREVSRAVLNPLPDELKKLLET